MQGMPRPPSFASFAAFISSSLYGVVRRKVPRWIIINWILNMKINVIF